MANSVGSVQIPHSAVSDLDLQCLLRRSVQIFWVCVVLCHQLSFLATQYSCILRLSMLGRNFSRQYYEIFFLFLFFFQKTGFDISCKLSPLETICMKYQSLFSRKNMKNIFTLSSAEIAQKVVKVN